MTAPLGLDRAAAARLATLDPSLRPLVSALPQLAEGVGWRLHDVVWTPGAGCRLAYRVPSPARPSAATGTAWTFLDVSVTADGWTQRDYRDDGELPGLARAADPELARLRIGQALDVGIHHLVVQPVRYRPGQRAVLRYDVHTRGGPHTYYAKVFRPDQFTTRASLTSAVAACAGGRDLVADVTATWDEAHAVVTRGVVGQISVSDLLGDPRLGSEYRLGVARQLGQLLARFHAQPCVPVPRWGQRDQLEQLDQTLAATGLVDVALAARVHDVCDLLAGARPAPTTDVQSHGSFRPGNVVMGASGRLVLLDTDGVAHAEAERDLGSLLAHLTWQGIRQPHNADLLNLAAAAFSRAYEEEGHPIEAHALRWWQAAALLLIAARRFRRLETDGWGRVPALVAAAQALLADSQAPLAGGQAPLAGGQAPLGGGWPMPDPLVPQGTTVTQVDGHELSVIGHALARHATDGHITVEAAHPLASASGRRRVVRYDVRGMVGSETTAVVAKYFADPRRAQLLHQNLTLLATPAATSSGLPASSLPEPLAHVPEHGLVVYRHREGTPVSELADPSARADGVRRAARWLAALHATPVTLPRRLDLLREADSTRAWAAVIGRAHPDLEVPARLLAESWNRNLTSDPAAAVPLHKDFHPGHVLVGAGLHVVDLDEARQGDPAFDVAHFCAYAHLVEEREAQERLVAGFLDEYAAAAGPPGRAALSAFEAYTWLKIARQWVVAAAPFRRRSAIERRAGVEHALERGMRCLSG